MTAQSSRQPFTQRSPCPVCNGYESLPRGKGGRCYGFLTEGYAHCTREEFSGGLPLESKSDTYAHRLGGPCRCGVTHIEGAARSLPRSSSRHGPAKSERAAKRSKLGPLGDIYDYQNADGSLLYQVLRYGSGETKTFRQRRPGNDGEWIPNIEGVTRVPYHLPELLAADRNEPVYVVEGEKDADTLRALGFIATTNSGGALHWPEYFAEYFEGRHAVILPDNDPRGIQHARLVAENLSSVAASVRVIALPDLPPKGDVSDWFAANGTVAELKELTDHAPEWGPDETEEPGDFPLTDVGNAERLAARHGVDVRYNGTAGGFFVWNGQRFQRAEEDAQVVQLAIETVRSIYQEAAEEPNPEKRQALARHATKSEALSRISAMVKLASSLPNIRVSATAFDSDPWLLNCPNGTVDLRTGELRRHRREDLCTKLAGAPYEPDAECPQWLAFLSRITGGNERLMGFLQRAVGYSMTGDISEQVLFLCHGTGANGKSTFLEIVRAMLGDYATTTGFDTFLARDRGDRATNDLAALTGARFVSAIEADSGKRLSESVVKQITGGDQVTARYLFREFFSYTPQFKLWLAANHHPTVKGTDEAIWRRLRLIPFTVTIPEAERDKKLPARLKDELPGILAWAMRGCLAWQNDGRLGIPDEVRAATQAYRNEMDVLGAFLEESCVTHPSAYVASGALYAAYTSWCKENGEHAATQRAMAGALAERGMESRLMGKDRRRCWVGIGLRSDEDEVIASEGDRKNSGFPLITTNEISRSSLRENCDPLRSPITSDHPGEEEPVEQGTPASDVAPYEPLEPPCPTCGVELRDGWCPICGDQGGAQ